MTSPEPLPRAAHLQSLKAGGLVGLEAGGKAILSVTTHCAHTACQACALSTWSFAAESVTQESSNAGFEVFIKLFNLLVA